MFRSAHRFRRARCAAALIALSALLCLFAPARGLRAQTAAPIVAVACTSDGSAVAFPLDLSGPTPLVGPPASANAVLSSGEPRLAASCQVVVEAPAAPDPFTPPAGTVTLNVSGAGIIVENGATSETIACDCGGATSDGATVTAAPALTFHVAQAPGAPLPVGPAPGAITVAAAYQPADGSPGASASTAIDIVPPAIRLELGAQPVLDRNGAYTTVQLTLRLTHFTPDGCTLIDDGPFISCSTPVSQTTEAGVEPGTATFSTSLGQFANGGQQLDVDCGQAPATPPVVPQPGVEHPFPLACDTLTATVALQGHVGDATFAASFRGAYTGASVSAQASVTVPPLPPSYRLQPGCTQVSAPLELPPSAPASLVAASVTPPEAVTAIWRPASGGWQLGYSRDPNAPIDFDSVTPGETLFVCVDALASYPLH